jgi:branched-subunit amino acid transport protein AzlD
MSRLSFHFGHIHVRLPNFHGYFLFWYRFKLTHVKCLTKVWPSSFLNFLMSKRMKFSEFKENPHNCSSFGFYIYNTHVHFWKQMSFLYTFQPKRLNMAEHPIFASGQDRYWCLPYPALCTVIVSNYISLHFCWTLKENICISLYKRTGLYINFFPMHVHADKGQRYLLVRTSVLLVRKIFNEDHCCITLSLKYSPFYTCLVNILVYSSDLLLLVVVRHRGLCIIQ